MYHYACAAHSLPRVTNHPSQHEVKTLDLLYIDSLEKFDYGSAAKMF